MKKVTMKSTMQGGNAKSAAQEAATILTSVRQSSMTHRQGTMLQSGPHTRSKSSAIGGETGIQMQARPSRKSNSRGRATPQNRLAQI